MMAKRVIVSTALLALALALPRPARADGPPPEWVAVGEARVTFYGPQYVGDGGELMASGTAYRKDNATVALGPTLLALVRDHYLREAEAMGYPMAWGWKPGLEFWYTGIAGCYFVPISLDEARLWGCGLRVCAETAGGGWLCREMRVMDSGGRESTNGIELGVDLPDEAWAWWGYPHAMGVFTGTVEVLAWRLKK